MQGSSWHANLNCPPRRRLVLLTVPYLDFNGQTQLGNLVVAQRVADELAAIFVDIFRSGAFRIQRMQLIDAFGGNDDASMAANNTSAFNCRLKTGGTTLSAHSFGTAIDINPVQNPYVTRTTTLPEAGKAFDTPAERMAGVTGIILKGDVVTKAFARRGWGWGGNWTRPKDYQHFSKDGT
jgi:poly-gamma-glutamate synthesis protein (capsule biosynthesis protein)